jgi:hypothetical protein
MRLRESFPGFECMQEVTILTPILTPHALERGFRFSILAYFGSVGGPKVSVSLRDCLGTFVSNGTKFAGPGFLLEKHTLIVSVRCTCPGPLHFTLRISTMLI